MRKNTLLIAVAAAALAVGSGTAFAQAPHQGAQKSDSPAVQQNPAAKNAPAEKIQGAEQHKDAASKAETTGFGGRTGTVGSGRNDPSIHQSAGDRDARDFPKRH